ncbi:DMT family transporter [Aggregatilineales bacterium SYSU G02658]
MTPRPDLRQFLSVFSAPVLLGLAPIFGKLALQAGADSFSTAALRTIVAVVALWLGYALFARRFLYIYPAGLVGCLVIGFINGVGSLFYYGGLNYLDASLVQLLNGSYLIFTLILVRFGGDRASWRTLARVLLIGTALTIITSFGGQPVNFVGVGLMLANALMFAGTVVLSQYVLYEMPPQTAALYVLTTMAGVVTVVWLTIGAPLTNEILVSAGPAIFALGVTTALSRIAMFASVKLMGSMQTAVLSITEIGVTLLLAAIFLGDTLTSTQWLGVALLFGSILLIRSRDVAPQSANLGNLVVANLANVQFQKIAFHRAFGKLEDDNEEQTMSQLTTQELQAIRRMMGAQVGGVDPFPIGKTRER